MSVLDLNRLAVTMAKVEKLLDEVENDIETISDLEEKWDDLCIIAYVVRLGIIDRIIQNPYMQNNPNLAIRIPTGLFSSRKETITSALDMTLGRLQRLASQSSRVERDVESVINQGHRFHEIDSMYNSEEKNKLIS